ncbi:hypothetical protein C9I86_03560 [Photobacterium sp. NCIMB 13483]|uniref:hypothetical protein n=1 Tax=Photobacterium sp. NCIMB 13483 TaxID=2022103 RepID=UPI000D15ED79|nr:hypothetical protein [Photobacterium sp. NCIMB 13483]PST94438.1 hypothetical protein C9I86_03560 [Photobacterium sp. NCIMB 13483]
MESPSIRFIIWHVIILVIIVAVSYCFRNEIEFKDVQNLISILQNTSAMIFTIMGLWIAYVYPQVILSVVQSSKVISIFSKEDERAVKSLVGVIVVSAMIMGILVIGTSLQIFIVKTSLFISYSGVFCAVGIGSLLTLTYAQLFCIYMVVISSVNFVIKLKNAKNQIELSKKLDGK